MPLLVDSTEALDRIKSLTDWTVDPVLTSTEVTRLRDDAVIASVWATATAYEFGAKVIPTANNRNGCMYRVVAFDGSGRTSGATEPSWSTSRESRVTDGNITWEECGSEPSDSLWNLNKAVRAGWELKASKVAADFDYDDPNNKMSAGQMHTHCLRQAEQFKTVEVA